MTKKKILHIITSLKQGGAESLLVYFLRSADTTEFEHAVIYFYDGLCAQQIRELGIPLYQIEKSKWGYTPFFFVQLLRFVRQLQPDCIHTWLWMANMAGRMVRIFLGVPVINTFHNNVDQDGQIRSCIDRLTYKAADMLVAVGPGVARSLHMRQKTLQQYPFLTIITNGIHADEVLTRAQQGGVQRADLGLSNDHFIIGSVGRFVALKNYSLLIRAFDQVYRQCYWARLVLIGSGPQEQELRHLVGQLGLEGVVHFVIGQSAIGYYPLFDCFALSSFKEGISIALLEAMSCGKPCVITNHMPQHDVINHGVNGLVVHPMEQELLTTSLVKMCQDSAYASQLAKNAFAAARNQFSLAQMTSSYYKLYKKFVEK